MCNLNGEGIFHDGKGMRNCPGGQEEGKNHEPGWRSSRALLTSSLLGDAEERFFDCASRPGDRKKRSPGKNKASGRSAQNDGPDRRALNG